VGGRSPAGIYLLGLGLTRSGVGRRSDASAQYLPTYRCISHCIRIYLYPFIYLYVCIYWVYIIIYVYTLIYYTKYILGLTLNPQQKAEAAETEAGCGEGGVGRCAPADIN